MLTKKENDILDKTEDAISRKLDEILGSNDPIPDATLAVVMDGIRILDRIKLMRGEDTSIQRDRQDRDHCKNPKRCNP